METNTTCKPVRKLNSKQLFDISNQAFEKGELDIAEKYLGKAIRKQKIENAAGERNPEPYYNLAVVLQQKAIASNSAFELHKRQKLLLQSTALYNFVRNCLKKSTVESEFTTNLSEGLPQKVLDVQDSIILAAGGNPSRCKFNSESKKKAMEQMRQEAKNELEVINEMYDAETGSEQELRELFIKQTTKIRILFRKIASTVKQLLIEIIQECVDVLGEPPCDYEVILLGSLAREEMTPYSDLEWAILTSSEEENCKIFFRNLTNLVHFQIINLGETILPCMDIEVLRGDWFYDDVTPRGLSFDGVLPQACKTPLGNTLDFELIHNPVTMANFQSNYWHKKNPNLGDILLTVAPLHEDKQVLLNEHKTHVEKILRESCDLDSCTHDVLRSIPTRGVCRGLSILRKDAERYGETMLENYEAYDGKLYDVKKEIYRLTDRVVSGLSKVFCVGTNGSFDILDELCERSVISSSAKDNLASAVAIALKLRLRTYFLAEKQEEEIKAKSNEATETNNQISSYHIPREKELFHFFYVSTPLYELLRWFCTDDKNSSEAFATNSFFDSSDVIKGHIHCRILNYVTALDCYKRALDADSGNIDLQLRQIRIEFILSKSPNVLSLMRNKLDALLQGIREKTASAPVSAVIFPQTTLQPQERIASKYEQESRNRSIEIYFINSQIYLSQGNRNKAREILEQCMKAESDMSDLHKLMIQLKLMKISRNQFTHKQCDEIISQVTALLKDEGISVKGLVWLNELGEFLLHHQKYAEAYQCLQRALTMGRALFGSNLNFNVVLTLYWLGLACVMLMMPEEGKFYFEQILTQLPSSKNQFVVMMFKDIYHQLALASILTDNYEDAIFYFEKALDSNVRESSANVVMDCLIYCTMATTWSKLDESDKAWQSALHAQDCLTNIFDTQQKVSLTCSLSSTFVKLGKSDSAMLLLKQGLTTEHDTALKVEYLKSLGQLCTKQGLMEDAERYYNNALEILRVKNENTLEIVSTLLNISKVLMKTKKSSEAVSYLSDASKYVLTAVDNENKCKHLKMIADCWEELGDFYNARKCLEQAIEVCAISPGNPKVVPIVEFDLHVQLGNLVDKILTSSPSHVGESSIPEKNEYIKKAQRVHYDKAGVALRQHLATGFFNSTTIQMFALLAGKYRSIDLLEEEKLLLEALKMSEEIYGPENMNELVASVLSDLADLYISKKEYESATDFFHRSLEMEIEIHSSDPYHHHIRNQIFLLNELYFGYPQCHQLKITMQRVLVFLEERSEHEAFMNSVEKASCFAGIAPLCFCSGDFEKAKKFNRIASDIFSTLQPNEIPQIALLDKAINDITSNLLSIVNEMPTQDLPYLHNSLVMFREIFRTCLQRGDVQNSAGSSNTHSRVSRNESGVATSFHKETVLRDSNLSENSVLMNERTGDSSKKMSLPSKTVELDPVATVNSSFQNISIKTDVMNEKKQLPRTHIVSREFVQEKDDDVPNVVQKSQLYRNGTAIPKVLNGSSKDLTVSDNSGFSHAKPSNETDKRENVNTVRKKEEEDVDVNRSEVHEKTYLDNHAKSTLLKKWKSDCDNICAVADSILYENRQGGFGLALKISKNSLHPLLASCFENLSSDPVQSLIHEAEQASKDRDIFRMIGSLDLASKFQSDSESKAKMFKLTGECQIHMQNYRLAAISFDKAVCFYRTVSTTLETKQYVDYAESLIGLTKSHLLCNDVQNAWCACQEGVVLISSIQPQPTTSRLLVELFYLAAKCTLQPSTYFTHEKDLEQVISFCQQALRTSEDVDCHSGSNDLAEELGSEKGEFFALKCEIKLLMASTLFRQKNLEEARNIVKELSEFLQNIDTVLEMFSADTWPAGTDDFSKIRRRLFSWIGRALVASDYSEGALTYLTKSLAIVLASASLRVMFPVEEINALLDAITVTITIISPEESGSAFQHTLEVCKRQFLEQNEKLKELWDFFATLGKHYVGWDRTEEAILVYETALAIAECLEYDDRSETRGLSLLYLANAHRLQAIKKKGKGVSEENHLAEKYYQTENGNGTENSSILKNIIYAEYLWDERRFEEAIIVLKQATEVGDTLWSRNVICLYSKHVSFGLDIQRYIESHGELLTSMGNLVYSSLVCMNVELGVKKEALEAYDKLSTDGKDLPSTSGFVTSCLPYLLAVCEKKLMSLIKEPRKLSFNESDFPLSAKNLAELYYELGEYRLTLKVCEKARMSTESTSNEDREFFDKLSTEHLAANALVMSGGSNTRHHYQKFLEMLHEKEKILDKSFDEQQAILSQYSFPEPYYVYRLLGMMLEEKRVDGRIACYEHCLHLQPAYDIDQSLVGTLADLYQTKAFTEDKDDEVAYQRWMDKAQGCFQKLLDKNLKMEPFVESTYASFLYRTKRFDEAISHCEQVIGSEIGNTEVMFSEVDIPLSNVYLAREIQTRGTVSLPLKIFVYHQVVLAYLQVGKLEKARESALQMEEYVNNFTSRPDHSIIHSFLAYTYKEIGNESKAVEIFHAVLNKEPITNQ